VDRSYSSDSRLSFTVQLPAAQRARPSIVRAVQETAQQGRPAEGLPSSPAAAASGSSGYQCSATSGLLDPAHLTGRSLGLFGHESLVRRGAVLVVAHRHFEKLVLALILASSVALALDAPALEPGSALKRALDRLDWAFVAAFLLEALLKAVARGLVFNGPGSYLRSGWRALDCAIALAGLATVVTESLAGPAAARQLMALRWAKAAPPRTPIPPSPPPPPPASQKPALAGAT
jgi:hypothetical protein